MDAMRCSAGSSSPNFARKVSKVQLPAPCESAAPGTSNGVAPSCRAVARTRSLGTNTNSAVRSMKRLTSQGQATRSILGRSRVTHFMLRLPLTDERDGRPTDRMPGGDAAGQALRVVSAAPELGDGIAADLEAVDAIGHDLLGARELIGP